VSGTCPKCDAAEALRAVREPPADSDLEKWSDINHQTMIDALEAIAHEKLKLCPEHLDAPLVAELIEAARAYLGHSAYPCAEADRLQAALDALG
jgi:hypothetical protein